MLAKRTKTPTVFSGVIALATLYGCSLQDYDYLGAGNKPPDDETEEPDETDETTEVVTGRDSSVESTTELMSDTTDGTSGPDASVTSAEMGSDAGTSSAAQTTSSAPSIATSESDPTSSTNVETSLPPETTSVDETSAPPLPPLVVEGNLIANSSFESAPQGWQVIGDAIIQATPSAAHTGTRSLVCKNRVQNWNAPGIDVLTLIEPGQTYVAKAWVRTNGEYGASFKMQRKARCIIDGGIEAQDEPLAYGLLGSGFGEQDEWVLVESAPFEPFAQRNCEIVEFVIYFEGPAVGEDIYLDDVSLVPYTP